MELYENELKQLIEKGQTQGYLTYDEINSYLPDEDASMWANLRTRHVELHREIREVYYGESEGLEAAFGERGPFWGRHYIFWSGGAPITVVYEVFNPAAFEKVLGPMRA